MNGMEGDEDFTPKIAVVGAGGMGSNLVNRLHASGIKSAVTIAINTDANHLNIIRADKKVLIGKELTRGLGAGGFPEVGAKAADASREDILKAVEGYNMIFIAAGMGGGTGGGAAPIIAQLAKESGALVVAFVSYPFSLERSRKQKADWSLEQLSKNADSTIVIENDRLLSYAPNLQMDKALELIDNIAANAVRGIADTITLPSLINLDFADLRSVMRDTGTAVINIGYGNGTDKVEKAVRTTLQHPLMDVDMTGAKSALVHVTGGESLTIEEATKIGEGVTADLDPKANVIFGARLLPELTDTIKVMSIVTGVKPRLGVAPRLNASAVDTSFIKSIESI
ncbi:MAG: cell division protein FtsZ [Candidatus Marsarchaeota archaeon]|jgi:cell division protein FtsZ|nr:cell division protein FtsZ [Candidatus Marsarchaeota archaeon]MCL5418327.1 cell division protein FtsZ [Candidatus Marsarchaeota archaeon]